MDVRVTTAGARVVLVGIIETRGDLRNPHNGGSASGPGRGDMVIIRASTGVSPSGKATDSDSVIRWFKSIHPSQFFCRIKPL